MLYIIGSFKHLRCAESLGAVLPEASTSWFGAIVDLADGGHRTELKMDVLNALTRLVSFACWGTHDLRRINGGMGTRKSSLLDRVVGLDVCGRFDQTPLVVVVYHLLLDTCIDDIWIHELFSSLREVLSKRSLYPDGTASVTPVKPFLSAC